MGRKKWNIASYDKSAAAAVANECGADDFAVLLLQSRGMTTAQQVLSFLNGENEPLSSPFLLKDMDKACERIHRAIDMGEKILIYGDYDADGVTATALLYSYLESVGAAVEYMIPSRINEGYGLSPAAAERISSLGVSLVITVDNGIAAFGEAEFFNKHSIDLIITDHHRAGATLPKALAVIDPHRADDTSPMKELAGVGVALKLASALEGGEYDTVLEDFSDLAAIGTVADIVPLTGENRTIVIKGLRSLENCDRPGVAALMEALGFNDKKITSASIAYGIAPRINAAGRMDSALSALELLLTEDEDRAQLLMAEINTANTLRQAAEVEMLNDTESYFEKNPQRRLDRVLVVSGKDWHQGVIGIVASRLVDKYGKPAVVISCGDDGTAKGSCRSIEGFSLYDALLSVSDTLLQFGGHTLAAGFSIDPSKTDEFRERINAYAAHSAPVIPSISIDCRLNPANITVDILDSLSLLEPFGAGNPAPVFGLFNMTIKSIKPIGAGKHIRLTLARQSAVVTAVWFGVTAEELPFREGDCVDIAVKTEKNVYLGEVRLSIQIKDMRPAGSDDEGYFRSEILYETLERGESLSGEQRDILCPDRTLLGKIYSYIQKNGGWQGGTEQLCMRTGLNSARAGAVRVCLDALCAVGILGFSGGAYSLTDFSGKADLSRCEKLRVLGYKNK